MFRLLALLAAVAPLLLTQCTNLNSESGLYNVPLQKSAKAGVDGYWFANKTQQYANVTSGSVYIAPLDVSRVSPKYPDLAPILQQEMDTDMQQSIGSALKQCGGNYTISRTPAGASMRIDLAVVKFKPQLPVLNTLGKVGSFFSPVPGTSQAIGVIAGGDIVIEGTIRDAKTGELRMAFKDHNRKSGRYINGTALTRTGQAKASLKSWADSLGKLLIQCNIGIRNGKTPQQMLDEESTLHAIKRNLLN